MKIAVLSDIHGNISALETAVADIEQWQPDQVVVNGDVVNRGPRSDACLEIILEKHHNDGWHLIKGNHEAYLLTCIASDAPQPGPQKEMNRFAYWACDQLGKEVVATFANWPDVFCWLASDGSEFRVTHAGMGDNRRGIFSRQSEAEMKEIASPLPAVFVTAHTHEPLMRHIEGSQIVNIGSVGAPFDGDRRLSYGRFQWHKETGWKSEIVRRPYDFSQIEKDYITSGFLKEAGPFAQMMLVELRRAGGLVFRWARRYQEPLLAGEIGIEESVRLLLRDNDLRPFLGPPGWSIKEIYR